MSINLEPKPATAPAAPAPKKPNWFRDHKVITGFGMLCIMAAIGGVAGGGNKTANTAAAAPKTAAPVTQQAAPVSKPITQPAAPATKPVTAPAAPAKSNITDDGSTGNAAGKGDFFDSGDWGLSKPKISNDGLGLFQITATATYYGSNTKGGSTCFDVLLSKGTNQVTSATGCPDNVLPGHTATVTFFSGDSFVSGPYSIQVQKTF